MKKAVLLLVLCAYAVVPALIALAIMVLARR